MRTALPKGTRMTIHQTLSETDKLTLLLPAMARLARYLTRSPDAADDLVQEAALKILGRLSDDRQIADLRPYVMATLRNISRSNGRQIRNVVEIKEDTLSVSPDAPRHLACAETRAAIERLPRKQAELMYLVAAGELSPTALALCTGCPVGTVMSRLSRARAALRNDLGLGPQMSVTELF